MIFWGIFYYLINELRINGFDFQFVNALIF